MVFATANDASPDDHKVIEVPQITTSYRPTASATLDGSFYYDETTNELTVCINAAWRTVDTTAE